MTLTKLLTISLIVGIAPFIWGTILGGIGAVKGIFDSINQDKAANRAANDARTAAERQAALAERDFEAQQKYLAELREVYLKQKTDGYYDAETRVQYAKNSADRYRKDNLENKAASLKTLGYKPGDSVMEKGFAETEALDTQNWARMVDVIRQQVGQEELGTLGLLNPKLADSSGIMNALGQNMQFNMADSARRTSMIPDMTQLFGTMIPYLDELGKKKKETAA